MPHTKNGHTQRIDNIQRAWDVTKMTDAELEHHARGLSDCVRARLKSMTNEQLQKIIDGDEVTI